MQITRISPGVVKVTGARMGVLERLIIPQVLMGMMVTIRHLVKNLFNLKKLPTISYPEVKRVYSERFRGRHILTAREDGTTRCVACYMCSTACPAECITIAAGGGQRARREVPGRHERRLCPCVFCRYQPD